MLLVTFDKPAGAPTFTEPWFQWFFPLLDLPEGHPVRWEGHLLLITHEFFRPELVHLTVVIPKGNWKTTWEGALGVWHLLTVPAPRVYGGAADLEQAKELYGFASHFASEPEFQKYLLVRESTREIRRVGRRAGILKILASDESKQGGKKQGKNTTLGLVDEEHAHENDNLRVDLTSGGFKRREAAKIAGDPLWWTIGKDVSITTAGHDLNGPLGLKRKHFLGDPENGILPIGSVETGLRVLPDGSVEKHPDGRLTICRSPSGSSVYIEWACLPTDDVNDMRVVKFASPASTVTEESLRDAKESPDLTLSQFLRYRCNIWTDVVESWLPDGTWDTLKSDDVPVVEHRTWEDATCLPSEPEEIPEPTEEFEEYIKSLFPPGSEIVAALDMARYRDCAAVVAECRMPDGRKVPRTIVWRSGGHEKPVSYDWPKTAIRRLHFHYRLLACGADEKYADQLMEELANEGIAIEPFPQSNERIGPADTELRKEILSDPLEFATDGDPILGAHVIAGAIKDLGESLIKIVPQDGPHPPPIDAARAWSMANALEKQALGISEHDLFALGEEEPEDDEDE